MNERERIGKRIAEIRKSKGLSQVKLAELTDLRAWQYSQGLRQEDIVLASIY